VLNPIWWISAGSGDCGHSLANVATLFVIVAGVGTARVVWLFVRNPARVG
jgi:hypothetical protein